MFWLGMVVAISFLEALLKFRAPRVTLPVGLGIGRLVFKALNVEVVLLLVLSVACLVARPDSIALILFAAVAALLMAQLAVAVLAVE